MKSNNKLQYLQKLASKNQQQQAGAPKKPSQSNNLVGIGQSVGQPYVVGPRFGQKQVKHLPKNTSSSVDQAIMPGTNKFTANKKNGSKSSMVVHKDYFNINMDIKDPRFDQFESIKMALGIFEDDDQIELLRKNNRKKQMARRLQKNLRKSILKSKIKDPTIKFEVVDEDDGDQKKFRKQVSISEEPRIGQSPGMAKDQKLKLGRKLKRNASDDRSNASLQIGQNPNSDLAVSSAGKNPEQDGLDEADHSIISEEDSAFEDQTPAARNKVLKEAKEATFTLHNDIVVAKRGDNSQSRIATDIKLKNDETVVGDMKAYIRQKTLGWKQQTNHDTTRWPFKRSPTHKSRNGDHESQGSKTKFLLKVVPSGIQKPKGFAQQSRHSSLNYTVDNQMDQLSVNVNKNLMFTNGGHATTNSVGKMESQSVASVITKGGTVINPFTQKKNSKQFLAKSHSKSSSMNIGISARGLKKETHLLAGEQDIKENTASKTHVRFGEDLQDIDVRKSYYKNNQKMINIYLKTPYKVLTIDQIKNKEKVDRELHLIEKINNGSPNRQLFIAENSLKIHTLFRENNKYATTKGKFKKNLINVSGEEEDLSNYGMKVRRTGFSSIQMKNLIKDSSISQISDQGGDKTKDLLDQESGPNINSSQDLMSDQNLIQLTSNQLKHLKTQKNQLEIEFKKKFYAQLQSQLEKRIEQVKFQTNILAKQKNLFAIYGNTTAYQNLSPDFKKTNFNNISIETIQAGIDLDDLGSNNNSKFRKLQAQQKKFMTATKAGESKLSRADINESPSKLEGSQANSVLKGSISRVQEPALVKQNTNASKYSRLSENEYTKDQDDIINIKEEDQLDQDEDEKEHRVTGYSYDFENEASLKKLLSMSNSLGYSQVQIRELREKQKQLEEAEKKLQSHQLKKGTEAYFISRNIGQNTTGSFVVLNGKPKKQPPKFGTANTRSKTDKKPIMREKLQSIKEKESKIDENRSLDNEDNVKDYFDNKISLRRSIDKKLHYDSKISQNKAAGQSYPTSTQKHQQLLADLKIMKKERARAYNLNGATQNTTEGSIYADLVPIKHQKVKTNVSLKNGPKGSLQDEKETVLPDIYAQSLRKQKSNIKDENQDPLDENFYPLKKSGTQNESKKMINDVGFSPIRLKRNNVINAYNGNLIQTTNPQFLASQGPYNVESIMTRHNNSSKKQLGFQFMNKSPRPSFQSNGLKKDSSFLFEKESPQKFNSNTTSSKFIHNKQVQLMKGVLSNPRKTRSIVKNKDLMHVNEISQGKLPQIHQSSSYAPGQ